MKLKELLMIGTLALGGCAETRDYRYYEAERANDMIAMQIWLNRNPDYGYQLKRPKNDGNTHITSYYSTALIEAKLSKEGRDLDKETRKIRREGEAMGGMQLLMNKEFGRRQR